MPDNLELLCCPTKGCHGKPKKELTKFGRKVKVHCEDGGAQSEEFTPDAYHLAAHDWNSMVRVPEPNRLLDASTEILRLLEATDWTPDDHNLNAPMHEGIQYLRAALGRPNTMGIKPDPKGGQR